MSSRLSKSVRSRRRGRETQLKVFVVTKQEKLTFEGLSVPSREASAARPLDEDGSGLWTRRRKCRLNYRRTEIMVCIGGTCSACSFSSCLLFHLTAKIKAYNQILLIGPDGGDRPTLSLFLSVLPSLARPTQRGE